MSPSFESLHSPHPAIREKAVGLQHQKNDFILLMIRLTNDRMDETFYLVCQIVGCERHPSLDNTFSCRAKFIFKDLKDREKIVKFVFEEERRIRRKEIG